MGNYLDSSDFLSGVLDWGYSDVNFLLKLANEHKQGVNDILDEIEGMGLEKTDINAWIYSSFYLAANNFKNEITEMMEDKYGDLNLDLDFINDFEENIYTNYLDSFYNSKLSEYDVMDFEEDNLKRFVEDILDDTNYFNNLDIRKELYDIGENIENIELTKDLKDKLESLSLNDDMDISSDAMDILSKFDHNLKDTIEQASNYNDSNENESTSKNNHKHR